MLGLLDHLEIDKTTLIGHSLGGEIATDFALTYPKRLSELVLVSPSLSSFRFSQEFEEWMQQIHAAAPDIEKIIELSLSSPSYRVIMAGPHRDLMVEMFKHHIKRTFEWVTFESVWPQPPAIENAAFRLIADKGYDAMSIDDIMSEIGKTKGSFYTHFQSKENLLYEVMETRLDRDFGAIAEETLKKLADDRCDVREIIREMLGRMYQGSGGLDPLWAAATYQVFLLSWKNPVVREWLQEQYQAWFMTTVIRRGQELGQIRCRG